MIYRTLLEITNNAPGGLRRVKTRTLYTGASWAGAYTACEAFHAALSAKNQYPTLAQHKRAPLIQTLRGKTQTELYFLPAGSRVLVNGRGWQRRAYIARVFIEEQLQP